MIIINEKPAILLAFFCSNTIFDFKKYYK